MYIQSYSSLSCCSSGVRHMHIYAYYHITHSHKCYPHTHTQAHKIFWKTEWQREREEKNPDRADTQQESKQEGKKW